MTLIQKRILFYTIIYGIISLIAVGTMTINMKTYTYIHKRHDLLLKLNELKDENRTLENTILRETSLDHVESIVVNQLGMRAPKQLYYIQPK